MRFIFCFISASFDFTDFVDLTWVVLELLSVINVVSWIIMERAWKLLSHEALDCSFGLNLEASESFQSKHRWNNELALHEVKLLNESPFIKYACLMYKFHMITDTNEIIDVCRLSNGKYKLKSFKQIPVLKRQYVNR